MSNGRTYNRDRNGKRFVLAGGMNLLKSLDALEPGEYAYLQNVRRQLDGKIGGRPTTGIPVFTLAAAPRTIVRLNDTSPTPVGEFRLLATYRIVAAGTSLYATAQPFSATEVATGFSGNPLCILPFGPDQSVQPWAYVGDSSQAVNILSPAQECTGMVKVRSDGLTRKTGIKEPQLPPQVGVNTTTITQYLTLPANTPPWTNIGGVNASYNYGGTDTQPPFPTVIATPVVDSKITLTVTGTATVNGATHGPNDSGPAGSSYPGAFITSPKIVVYAFTDADGNVLAQSTVLGAPPVVGNVGSGTTLTVPSGASQLQIGIDSQGGTFSANSGSYLIQANVSTTSVATNTALVGNVLAYIWGDSPHSGPVANYIWKNPNDVGTGIARTIGTAQANSTNNSLVLGSNAGGVQDDPQNGGGPVQWTTLNPDGSVAGVVILFDPALESEGYQDFNAIFTGSIFVPVGGTYAVTIVNKDQILFGMGGGVTSDQGQVIGQYGQTETVASALPLMYKSTLDPEGGAVTATFHLTFPNLGVYPFEIDWDYWYHDGRQLQVTMAATPGGSPVTIPPLPQGVRTNVQYWYKYRASETGAQSNQSPASPTQQTPVLANTLTSVFSTDPQADKVDYYRQDEGLPNQTYVITGPNDGLGPIINGVQYNSLVTDTLTDLEAAANNIMQTDDFEPFPSIDAPQSGMVTIIDGVITWKSGDKFNTRWLPGTLILIGSPSQNAYSFVARPISSTQIIIPGIPDTIGDAAGGGVPYNIAQPILAQQPMPSMWGPDAYGYMHACGDPNQPGAYLWTKPYNPDSAPQTNRLLLTSPSEPLMGGDIVNGISMVFSNLRAWLIYPNFADAQATTEGTVGTPWNPIPAAVSKGLYILNCLCRVGGKAIAYRTSDGISLTSGGPEKSLTDERIYNLFPHEGFTPSVVQIGPYTAYPPNDNAPQTLTYQPGYIYYDYTGIDNAPHTLVFDEAAKGWSVDVGAVPFTCHGIDYDPGVSDTIVGRSDGSLCILQAGGTEAATSVVATGADNAGDARALKRVGDVFVRALVASGEPVNLAFYESQYQTAVSGLTPASISGTGELAPYIIDGAGAAIDLIDLEMILSWNTFAGNELDLWQPVLMPLPAAILSRRTDGIAVGRGYQHVYLANLTFAATEAVTVTLNTDQGEFSQTWPASGTLGVLTRVMMKFPPNKFKVCEYEITSGAEFYLFGCEIWVGPWDRSGPYEIINPFSVGEAGL
jgi:hypothetical protein